MPLAALAVYRPAWVDGKGRRTFGPDEDEVTAAVVAVGMLQAAGHEVDRVVLVTASPDPLEGDTAAVVAHALGDAEVPVERRVGGPGATVDALLTAAPGTAVVAVDPAAPAAAAAAYVAAAAGAALGSAGRVAASLPGRVRAAGEATARVYDDPRLLRERGWRPVVARLAGEAGAALVVGVPAPFAKSLSSNPGLLAAVDVEGPAAPLLALGALVDAGRAGRVVAVDGAAGVAVDLLDAAGCDVVHQARPPVELPPSSEDRSVEIPISLAAYGRAFEAKVGLLASRCRCGAVEHPPRAWCPECGQATEAVVRLPRDAEVYSVVTVRTPVPAMRTPYSIAVASIAGTEVRVLVPVTDVPAGTAAIGDRGRLVLRRVAVRRGIPDYGYAFQPLLNPSSNPRGPWHERGHMREVI